MQQTLVRTAGFTARFGLAVFFISHAIGDVSPGALGALAADVGTGTHALDLLAAVFFALVALWLVLGIYSRIIAIIGIVVFCAEVLLFGGTLLQPALVLAGLATVILGFTGGGPLRLHAGGWRLRDCR
jgi:hypothetical protein